MAAASPIEEQADDERFSFAISNRETRVQSMERLRQNAVGVLAVRIPFSHGNWATLMADSRRARMAHASVDRHSRRTRRSCPLLSQLNGESRDNGVRSQSGHDLMDATSGRSPVSQFVLGSRCNLFWKTVGGLAGCTARWPGRRGNLLWSVRLTCCASVPDRGRRGPSLGTRCSDDVPSPMMSPRLPDSLPTLPNSRKRRRKSCGAGRGRLAKRPRPAPRRLVTGFASSR